MEEKSKEKSNETLQKISSKRITCQYSGQCSSADAKKEAAENGEKNCEETGICTGTHSENSENSDESNRKVSPGEDLGEASTSQNRLDCPVCLQTVAYPVRLPCQHVFCFLCVKGVTNRTRNCPMCRSVIPVDYFEHPDVVSPPKIENFSDSFQWFYEGKNGWWAYDERSNAELEKSFAEGKEKMELLIAGHLYVIDFAQNFQFRRNEPKKRRQIKRDFISAPKKGVAGLKLTEEENAVVDQINSLNLNSN